MRALTALPGHAGSHRVEERPPPVAQEGELLVEAVAVGVCGTDREILAGDYGWAPPGRERLVIGHESLGRVLEAPTSSPFSPGSTVVGVVRRPDPVPCGACAAGEFDMCRNGRYRERGIKEMDGYAAERWTVPEDFAVAVDPALGLRGVLTEPASVVAKAWEQIEAVGRRAWFSPRSVLVTGAGPIGLLAALMGVQRELDVHVLDRVADGPKPDLVSDLGAHYHHAPMAEVTAGLQPDIVIEGTGVASLVFDGISGTGPYGIVCLTGVSSGGRSLQVDAGALNRELVLENDAVIGSVNANQRHFELAARALAQAEPGWLDGLITRTVPLDHYEDVVEPDPADVKVVLTFGDAHE
ncbi:glucose 1-dehydrogenase [Nocardioides panacisoli]|uniref:Glucose 1-dehydrogenase n=1 Tax=Nocardioides panacisoli TaxID=627624 RepID=A0ABP7J7J2_9ACTN